MPMLASRSKSMPSRRTGSEREPRRRTATSRAEAASHLRQQYSEFVAAQSGHQVAGADAVCEAVGDGLQEGVAGVVSESVVDLFEPVEVEQEQPDLVAAVLGVGDLL